MTVRIHRLTELVQGCRAHEGMFSNAKRKEGSKVHFVLWGKLDRTLLSTYFKQNGILLARTVEPDGVHSILICDYHRLCRLCRRGCPNGGVHLRGFPFKRCHQLSYKLRVLLCSILLWETEGRQEGTSRGE